MYTTIMVNSLEYSYQNVHEQNIGNEQIEDREDCNNPAGTGTWCTIV